MVDTVVMSDHNRKPGSTESSAPLLPIEEVDDEDDSPPLMN